MWWRLLVWLGFRIWVRPQYNRPKFALCVFHSIQMKRVKKTEFGAFYHCPKCKRDYHIQCKGNKFIPV